MKKIIVAFCLCKAITPTAVAQNIGIGTNSPVEKLQVLGNIKADTLKPNAMRLTPNAGAGKVLTSDGAGNASWQKFSANGEQGGSGWGDCSMNGLGEYQAFGDTSGAADDHYGYRVAIAGDFAIIGDPLDDVGANTDQGSVSFFHFNGTNWDLVQKTTEAGGSASDYFGCSVSLSGDYAIVGVAGDDIGANITQGSAIIYHYNGSSWVLQQKLTDPTGLAGDTFGIGVAIDGNTVIIGADQDDVGFNNDQGSACIFQYVAGTWTFKQKITDSFGGVEDQFGHSLAISGNNLVIGEPGDDVGSNPEEGSVLFYYFNGSSWVLRIKQTEPSGQANSSFGFSVSISGNNVVVGSVLYDYTKTDQGAACVYHLNGSNWDFIQRLVLDEPGEEDGFGYNVSISGNYIIVGAPYDDVNPGDHKGSASIYQRIGVGWSNVKLVRDKMGSPDDQFGFSVTIDGNSLRFITGASGYANSSGKILFGKVL